MSRGTYLSREGPGSRLCSVVESAGVPAKMSARKLIKMRENVHLTILRQRILIWRQISPVKRSRENVHQPRIWAPNSLHFAHAVHFAHGGPSKTLFCCWVSTSRSALTDSDGFAHDTSRSGSAAARNQCLAHLSFSFCSLVFVFSSFQRSAHDCGALSEDQYGFRKGRSCPDLLLTAVDDWCRAKDAKQYTAVAFVDLSKAFDCARHDLLLQTLQSHGLGGTVLKWFHHYLTDWQQCIMLQDPPLTFNCSKGVPQGSVLGPLLFNLYMSDVGRIAKKLKASLPSFADDFTLYASRATPVAACRVVSETLTELKDALEDRGLVISCEKTVAMLIPPNPHLTASFVNCTITCGDTDLKFVH